MINVCTATTMQHWFSKFFKLFETFSEFHVFVFSYRAASENAELEENKIRVIFAWENLWKGIRISSGLILSIFYQRRKEMITFRGFHQFPEFRGIDLANKIPCCMRDSACRLKKLKYSKIMLNVFETFRVWETVESWLVYKNTFSWIIQSYFLTGTKNRS